MPQYHETTVRSRMVGEDGYWSHNVIHWPRLIGGELDGQPAPLVPPLQRRVTIPELPGLPVYGDSTEPYEVLVNRHDYDRRVLGDDGQTILVGLAAVELTTEQVRLQLLLSHPDASIG